MQMVLPLFHCLNHTKYFFNKSDTYCGNNRYSMSCSSCPENSLKKNHSCGGDCNWIDKGSTSLNCVDKGKLR